MYQSVPFALFVCSQNTKSINIENANRITSLHSTSTWQKQTKLEFNIIIFDIFHCTKSAGIQTVDGATETTPTFPRKMGAHKKRKNHFIRSRDRPLSLHGNPRHFILRVVHSDSFEALSLGVPPTALHQTAGDVDGAQYHHQQSANHIQQFHG